MDEGMGPRGHHRHPAGVQQRLQLVDRRLQIGARLGRVLADAGDHLDARLEEFVLGLGVLAAPARLRATAPSTSTEQGTGSPVSLSTTQYSTSTPMVLRVQTS